MIMPKIQPISIGADAIFHIVLQVLLGVFTLAFIVAHAIILPAELIVLGLTIDPRFIAFFVLTIIEVVFKDASIVFNILVIINPKSIFKSQVLRIVAYSIYAVTLIIAAILTVVGGIGLSEESPALSDVIRNPMMINMSMIVINTLTAAGILLSLESTPTEPNEQVFEIVPIKDREEMNIPQ